MPKRKRQLSAAIATVLVLSPLMTPVAHAKVGQSERLLATQVTKSSRATSSVADLGILHPLDKTTNQLAPGINDEKLTFNNKDNSRTVIHTVNVDLKDKSTSLVPRTKKTSTGFQMANVLDTANDAVEEGKQVVAAVNADFFDMGTGEPSGNVLIDGQELHAAKKDSGEAFFGILKDSGKAVIGTQDDYLKQKDNLKQALGGLGILVKDGKVQSNLDGIPTKPDAARSAVGIRENGSVFFVTIDGQQPGYSNGMTPQDLAQTMKDKGAVDALNFDGGGSATYVSRTPGQNTLSIKNKPSDGHPRSVSNTWLVETSTASDHTFDRAEVTPKDQAYTPNSTVHFKANGVDKAGYAADLPSDATWSLRDGSLGKIDAKMGTFISNGKSGNVTAELRQGSKVIGSSTVAVQTPDEIFFDSKQLSLEGGKSENLGLHARYQGREVNLKAGDIDWTVPDGMGVVDDKGKFTASISGKSGTIKATLHGTTHEARIDIQLGQLPKVLWNFEDKDSLASWDTAGAIASKPNISLANSNDGQVRFGDQSLRMDFDFTTGGKATTLGAYTGPKTSVEIPGNPTAIGMWVYGTPEAQGYWLRMQVHPGGKGLLNLNFTPEHPGINWLGWKYVEAKIDSKTAMPLTTWENQAIRLMSTKAGQPNGGPVTKGHIFVDNIRAVYGVNKDDTKAPIIESIDADGKTFTGNNPTITVKTHEDTNDPNASGMDWEKNKIAIDGQILSIDKSHYSFDPDGSMTLRGYKFADGKHHIKVSVYDKFGNRTDKDAYFTVKTGNQSAIHLKPVDTTAKLGSTAEFDLTADDVTKLKSGKFKFSLTPGFTVRKVEFAEPDAGNTHEDNASDSSVTLNVSKFGTDKTKPFAKVFIDIPKETEKGTNLTYQMVQGMVTPNETPGPDVVNTFGSEPHTVKVQADYTIQHQPIVLTQPNMITVMDTQKKPVTNAKVSVIDAKGTQTELGTTDAQGQIDAKKLPQVVGKFSLVAEKDGKYSFVTRDQVFEVAGDEKPFDLLAGSTQDPTTRKTITWFTAPAAKPKDALMQIAPDGEYRKSAEQAFKTQKGFTRLYTYSDDSKAVQMNRVDAKGLKPGTAYAYRVGDGHDWSDVRHFTTLKDSDHLTFNVLGDTQVNVPKQLHPMDEVFAKLEAAKTLPDFAIHVGDFNDNQTTFKEADMTAQMFNKHTAYDSLDMIHVLGNHEYMGDDGTKATEMLGVPGNNGPKINTKGTYSVDYGNMHIASIGWTDNVDEMQQELDWLRKDMKATNKTWRIVTTHQPAYNKNPADSESSMFHKMLPPVCDELGIDIVFSGHDHSYGRTYPLVGGKKVTHGTTYIAAGHTGDKTYDIRPNEPEVWDYIQKEADKDQKTFLTLSVNGNKMVLVTRDENGKQIDSKEISALNHSTVSGGHSGNSNVTSPSQQVTDEKSALETAIKDAEKLKAGDYTSGSFTEFEKALTRAKELAGNATATKDELKAAHLTLIKAQSGLKPVDVVIPDSSKPAKPGDGKSKVPAKVVGVRGLALYRKPNFAKSVRMNGFRKQPQMHQPQFEVLGVAHSKNGRLRFHVKDINRKSKTYHKTGYITASSKYVQSAEYTKTYKKLTVISAKGLNAYKSMKLVGKIKKHYHQGKVLRVKRLIHRGKSVVFQLMNNSYISSNKNQVQAGMVKLPKRIKAKHAINLYRDVNLQHKKHGIISGATLKVVGWDYSSHGTLRYRVSGGYITANHKFLK